jgi:hypothetical protein
MACCADDSKRRSSANGVSLRFVADRLEASDALLQRRIVETGDAGLDGVIEPFQAEFGLGGALAQLGDVRAAALGAFLPAFENGCQNLLEPLRLKQTICDVPPQPGCPASPSGSSGLCS